MTDKQGKQTISVQHTTSCGFFSRFFKSFRKKNPASRSYRYLARQIETDLNSDKKGCGLLFTSPVSLELTNEALLMFSYILLDELGHRILLIDATFREGGVGSQICHHSHPGLTDLLYGTSQAIEQICVPTNYRDITIMPAGTLLSRSGSRIDPEKLRQFFHSIRDKYDYILVQTGSIVDDSRYAMFSQFIDLVLLFVENRKTFMEEIDHSIKIIKKYNGANVRLVLTME